MLPIKFQLGRNQEQAAMNKYNQKFDVHFYRLAVENKSNRYANDLINEALALCGHPFYRMSNREWSQEAQDFLAKFAESGL
jgi:hypothetical protein